MKKVSMRTGPRDRTRSKNQAFRDRVDIQTRIAWASTASGDTSFAPYIAEILYFKKVDGELCVRWAKHVKRQQEEWETYLSSWRDFKKLHRDVGALSTFGFRIPIQNPHGGTS